MRRINIKIIALFLFSIVLIAYELYVMRVFSVGSWSNFGFLVISTALLGFGAAGTLLTLIDKRIKRAPNQWLARCAIAFIPAMALGYVVSQQIPFNPILISQDALQILWVGVYYLIFGIPFFIGAMFIGIMFMVLSSRMHQLYFWNMAGSGLGGIIVLLFMYLLPPGELIYPLILFSTLAAFFSLVTHDPEGRRYMIKFSNLVAAGVVLAVSVAAVVAFGGIKVSEYKSISYARNYRDAKLVHHSYSPLGEMHVYASGQFHSAPGLSDMAIIDLLDTPRQDFWGLFTDGDGPMYLMGKQVDAESAYMEYLPMAAPYKVLVRPNVLLVNLNGGISARLGIYNDASHVTIAEPNPDLVRLLKDDPVVSRYTGDLLRESRISVAREEPRAHCVVNRNTYDLIEISLIDAIGFDKAQGYSITENYRYTKEAVRDYLGSLTDNGILSITVWNMIEPPRNVLKLLSTILAALKDRKSGKPGDHLFAFCLHRSTATILVKKSAFQPDEIEQLRTFVKKMSFEQIYYPSMPPPPDWEQKYKSIMTFYVNSFSNESKPLEKLFRPVDFYSLAIHEILEDREEKLYQDYIFDISPMTDDRPYYSSYLKVDRIFTYLAQPLKVIEEWGFLLILAVFAQSLIFAALIVLIPLTGRFRELLAEKKRTLKIIVYFSCLGLGYMLMEMFLIQRLVFFLSDPIFSTSIVITSMLIISGLGSLASAKLATARHRLIRWAVFAIVVTVAFYLFGLPPLLSAALGLPFLVKALIAVAIVAPAAFFMGMPFPNALAALDKSRPRLLPWAWGMNGALSVTGSVLARLISIPLGFSFVLVVTALVYVAAAFLFRANEA
jgi:predicted membrane-bound spermidine synthase